MGAKILQVFNKETDDWNQHYPYRESQAGTFMCCGLTRYGCLYFHNLSMFSSKFTSMFYFPCFSFTLANNFATFVYFS